MASVRQVSDEVAVELRGRVGPDARERAPWQRPQVGAGPELVGADPPIPAHRHEDHRRQGQDRPKQSESEWARAPRDGSLANAARTTSSVRARSTMVASFPRLAGCSNYLRQAFIG